MKFNDLLQEVSFFDDDRDNISAFEEFLPDKIEAVTEKATLIEWRGKQHWIPLSQLRRSGSDLFASNWILKQKGIET